MNRRWQLQEAKANLSRLIKKAAEEGPQTVTLHGVDTAVVLSIDEYQRLKAGQPTIRDVLLGGPKFEDDIVDLIDQRSPDTGRTFEW
jgi:antitoxin Phd